MLKRFVSSLGIVATLLLATPLLCEEPGDLMGRTVMLVAADVTFRTGPSANAAVAENPTGGFLMLTVTAVEGEWVQIKGNWAPRENVVTLDDAVAFFSAQIERQPTSFAYVSRSEALSKERNLDEALADAENAIRLDPTFALGYEARAHISMIRGEFKQSLRDFEKALALEPGLQVARAGRSVANDLLNGSGARAGAGDVAHRRSNGERLFDSALEKELKGNHRQAIADLEEAVRVEPELQNARFFSRRSHLYFMLHEFEKAARDLREAVLLEPENADHYDSLGMVYSVQEDFDGAIAHFTRAYELLREKSTDSAEPAQSDAVRLNPYDPLRLARGHLVTACHARANQRRTIGDAKGAKADYDRAIEVDPKSSIARIGRALFLASQGDYDGGLKDCDVAFDLDPATSWPLCARASVFQMKGDVVKAIDTLNQAIILFPQDAAPYSTRGAVWGTIAELGKALDDFNHAIELEPDNPLHYAQRATLFRELKREDEAAADDKKSQDLLGALSDCNERRTCR